jgi:hypothetical protein
VLENLSWSKSIQRATDITEKYAFVQVLAGGICLGLATAAGL